MSKDDQRIGRAGDDERRAVIGRCFGLVVHMVLPAGTGDSNFGSPLPVNAREACVAVIRANLEIRNQRLAVRFGNQYDL
jgi:hypothetical protein